MRLKRETWFPERLVETALLSLDRALTLRGEPTRAIHEAQRAGRRRLLLKLGYMHLTELNGGAARAAIRRAWQEGARVNPRSLGIYLASLVPAGVLGGIRRVKRW